MSPLFGMFGLHGIEFIIVGVVILLLFGNRLPSLMRSLGRSVVEFKHGVKEIEEGGGEEDEEEEQQRPKASAKR